jgi:hypothetical protein|nr:MAG TPA: minor structural protein [Caudoviricetes sp.]
MSFGLQTLKNKLFLLEKLGKTPVFIFAVDPRKGCIQTMTLEEIYSKLKEIDGGAEMTDAVRKELTSLRNEAKENRLAKEEILRAIGAKNADEGKAQMESLNKLMEKLKEANTNPDAMVTRLSSLEDQVTALTKASNDAKAAAEKAKQEQIASQKHSALIEALTAAHAVSPAEISKLLSSQVSQDDAGALVFSLDDGTTTDIKTGVENYLKSNPWAVPNNGNPGGGSHAPIDNSGHKYTGEEIQNMSIDDINKNWDDIVKSSNSNG